MRKITFLLFLLFTTAFYAQVVVTDTIKVSGIHTKKQVALLTAANLGKNGYLELGVARNYCFEGVYGMKIANGYYFSTEVRPGDNLIVAPKVGVWASALFAVGAEAIYYTNFDDGSLCLRPAVGFGWSDFKLMYGYNIPITNKDMKGVNGSNFSLTFFWRLGGERF
jgi:hypothetical protein